MTTANTTAPSLKLLAEDKEHTTGVSKLTSFRLDPDIVTIEDGFNVRTDDDTLAAHIDRLYLAMKNGAAIPPIDVRVEAGKTILVDGYCRTTAAKRLKLEVPDYTLEARNFRGNEQERVLHMLGTGSGQKPLTPLEQGLGYLRLVKYGMTSKQIAEKLGVSSVTVDNGLTLAEAPVAVQDLVRSGTVSSTLAREAVQQGAEGIKALTDAAKEASETPTPTKTGKKSKKGKKVTAKKLKGTAADKSTRKPAKKGKGKAQTVAEWNKDLSMTVVGSDALGEFTKSEFLALASAPPAPSTAAPAAPVVEEGQILLKLNKVQAQAVVEFLRANAPEEAAGILEFTSALEMALM